MKLDCYAVLGLSPAAEDAVIRAAYLALMRSYHPDRNPSAEAAARARAVTEAYKTIGDPARRAEYDERRRAHQFEILGYDEEEEPPPRLWRKAPAIQWPKVPVIQWPRAPVIGGVAASALTILLAVMVLPSIRSGRADMAPPRTTDPSTGQAVSMTDAAAVPSRRMETNQPPEPAASVSASPPPAPADPTQPETAVARSEPARATRPDPIKADPPPRPIRTAKASSPPPAERAAPPKPAPVDEKARIATLEWQSTSFYNQSVNHADGARRSRLQQARDLFVTSRNACKSDKCVGDAHVSYMRDISQIMQKPRETTP